MTLLEQIGAALKHERYLSCDRIGVLSWGKYKGYKARCAGVMIDEVDQKVFFRYLMLPLKKDGSGLLADNSATTRSYLVHDDDFVWANER